MAFVNRQLIEANSKAVMAVIEDSLGAATNDALVRQLSQVVTADVPMLEMHMVYDFVELREWIGERKASDFISRKMAVSNRKYEATVYIERDHMENAAGSGLLSLYEARLRQMGDAYPRRLIRQLSVMMLQGGEMPTGEGFGADNSTTYDGVPFFSDEHPIFIGEPSDDMIRAGIEFENTYSNVTEDELDRESFDAAVTAMSLQTDWRGEPMGVRPTHLVVGPRLEAKAKEILSQQKLVETANGAVVMANELYNAVELIVNPYLGNSEAWFLFDLSKPLKPFLFHQRGPVERQRVDDPTSDYVMLNDRYLYGLRARFGMAYAFPQLAFAGNLS